MFKVFALAVFVLAGTIGTAHATLITSIADPSLSGSTVIDFDSATLGNATSFNFGDVTFSTSVDTLRIAVATEGGADGLGASGKVLSTRFLDTLPQPWEIAFANPVSAFGMDWIGANFDWTVTTFDSSNVVLETLTFSESGFTAFYGASGIGIGKVEITSTGNNADWMVIDDFHYVGAEEQVIPEPTTVALLGIGLVGLAGAEVRRRRKKKAVR